MCSRVTVALPGLRTCGGMATQGCVRGFATRQPWAKDGRPFRPANCVQPKRQNHGIMGSIRLPDAEMPQQPTHSCSAERMPPQRHPVIDVEQPRRDWIESGVGMSRESKDWCTGESVGCCRMISVPLHVTDLLIVIGLQCSRAYLPGRDLMATSPPESMSIFQLEKRKSLASRLLATLELLLAGILFSMLSLAVIWNPSIAAVVRWAAMVPVLLCWLFVVAAMSFLWFPNRLRRLYFVIERTFVVLLLVALASLTAALLWQTFVAG